MRSRRTKILRDSFISAEEQRAAGGEYTLPPEFLSHTWWDEWEYSFRWPVRVIPSTYRLELKMEAARIARQQYRWNRAIKAFGVPSVDRSFDVRAFSLKVKNVSKLGKFISKMHDFFLGTKSERVWRAARKEAIKIVEGK